MSNEGPVKKSRFDPFAPVYDLGFFMIAYFAGGERTLRQALLKLAGPLKERRVLELFAGTATLSLQASEKGAKVTAVDLSAGMLGVAKEKVKKSGCAVNLIQADASLLPIEGELFDTAIISLGLHEIASREVKRVLAEVCRVLKKEGRLVILDFHKAGKGRAFYQKLFFTFTEPDTIWEWLDLDIQTLLRESGFGAFKRTFTKHATLQYISVRKRL